MNLKTWKPKSSRPVWDTYGKVIKVSNKHVLLLLDLLLPMFWVLALAIKEKELFRITTKR